MSTPPVVDAAVRVPDNSARHAPALTVAQGAAFTVKTADRFAGAYAGEPVDPAVVGALVGPVAIDGVRPGDVLAVEVLDILPANGLGYVITSHRYGLLGQRVEPRVKQVSVADGMVRWDERSSVPYRPMIGKLGLAPPGEGESSNACGDFGGALSNTRIAPGASVWLRAHHPGGLLSLEDVHAGMGDGEATASAFEMPAEVTLRCRVVEAAIFDPPVIVTNDEVMTLGQGDTLDAASGAALDAMLALIQARRGVDLTEAAMFAGTVVDIRVSFIGAQPRKAYAAIPRALVAESVGRLPRSARPLRSLGAITLPRPLRCTLRLAGRPGFGAPSVSPSTTISADTASSLISRRPTVPRRSSLWCGRVGLPGFMNSTSSRNSRRCTWVSPAMSTSTCSPPRPSDSSSAMGRDSGRSS